MSITSFAELERKIKQAVSEGVTEAGKEGEKVVKDKIDSEVYAKYSPEDTYSRTYELRESVDSKESGDMEVEIYHDTSKINPSSPNQHMSVVDGSSSADYIPDIVHNGGAPNLWNDRSYAWMGARPYMDKAEPEIKKKTKEVLERELKKKGFKI